MILKDNMVIKCVLRSRLSKPIFNLNYRLFSLYSPNQHGRLSHGAPKDYYQVLNIKKNSTRKEIKLAYYKLSKKYHPDVSEMDNSEEKYKDIQEAYHVLGDERRKADYDDAIRDGHYDGDSSGNDSVRYGGGNRAWKKRSGPIYTGRTSHYDYDEYYRGHYGSSGTTRKTPYSYSSSSNSNEDLNSYWNNKEFSSNDAKELRNRLLFKSSFALLGTVILYQFILYLKRREENAMYRNYLRNVEGSKKEKT